MPLPAASYLDLAVDGAGQMYVLYHTGDGTAPADYRVDIYTAAGGSHPDLAEYDRVMTADRRTAVLLTPERFTTNPPGAEHVEPATPEESSR